MHHLFKDKNKRKKSPEPPQPEIPTKTTDRPPERDNTPKGGRSLSYWDLDIDSPDLTAALGEGTSGSSRIAFHSKENEDQRLAALNASIPGAVIYGTGDEYGPMGECF